MSEIPPRTVVEGAFDKLDPEKVFKAVEESYGLEPDGSLTNYPSYINRVYGLKTEDGDDIIAKFYRPGRWTEDALLDEHRYLIDCAEAEIPVASPVYSLSGSTLAHSHPYFFTLFEKKGGRNFDAESEEDWLRMGALIGRLHLAGRRCRAEHRIRCSPASTGKQFEGLLLPGLVHPDLRADLEDLVYGTLGLMETRFAELVQIRLHGDLHRGNILDRLTEGLFLMDFDDMMSGPPVQDLWLLLPDYAENCENELRYLIEGYERFLPFEKHSLDLIESLRFMRMIHFAAWQAHQRFDAGFGRVFPDWGSEAFWIKEVEDLRVQSRVVENSLR